MAQEPNPAPYGPVSDAEHFLLARWKFLLVEALQDYVFASPDPVRTAAEIGMDRDALGYLRARWYERLTVDALVVWCHRAGLSVRFPASTRI